MRRLIFMIFLSVAMAANADILDAGFFGTNYDVAVKVIEKEFGKPAQVANANELKFTDIKFADVVWNEAHFKFIGGVLSEARFYSRQTSKPAALRFSSKLATTMEKQHSVTKDYEDEDTFFYKGGKSPMDFGHLFTIFVSPYKGVWSTQLRYGPFEIK